MKKYTKSVLIAVLFLAMIELLLSCSSSDPKLFEGKWIVKQSSLTYSGKADDKSFEHELGKYNFWDSKDGVIRLSNYHVSIQKDEEVYELDQTELNVNYQLMNREKIVIDDIEFKIKLQNNKMTISNSTFEMQFERLTEK
jgi:hypothetical protein